MASINRLCDDFIRIRDLDVRLGNNVRALKPFDRDEEAIIEDTVDYIQDKASRKNPVYVHYYNLIRPDDYENEYFDELMELIFFGCYHEHQRRGSRNLRDTWEHVIEKAVASKAVLAVDDYDIWDDLELRSHEEDKMRDSVHTAEHYIDTVYDYVERNESRKDNGRDRRSGSRRDSSDNDRSERRSNRRGESNNRRRSGGDFGDPVKDEKSTRATSRRGSHSGGRKEEQVKPEPVEEKSTMHNKYSAAMSRPATTYTSEVEIPDPKITDEYRDNLIRVFRERAQKDSKPINIDTIVRWDEGIRFRPSDKALHSPAFDIRSTMLYYIIDKDGDTLPALVNQQTKEEDYMDIEQHLGRGGSPVARRIAIPDEEMMSQEEAINAIIATDCDMAEVNKKINISPVKAYVALGADNPEEEMKKISNDIYGLTDINQGFVAAKYTQSVMRNESAQRGDNQTVFCTHMNCAVMDIAIGSADASYMTTMSRMDARTIHKMLNEQATIIETHGVNESISLPIIEAVNKRFTDNINYVLTRMLGLDVTIEDFMSSDGLDIYNYLESNYPSHYEVFKTLEKKIVADTMAYVKNPDDINKMLADVYCDDVPSHVDKPDVRIFLSDHTLFYTDFDSRVILKGTMLVEDVNVIKREKMPVLYKLFARIIPKSSSGLRKHLMRFRDGVTISVSASAFDDSVYLIKKI